MMVAKNKAAAVKAEADMKVTQAKMESRVFELKVEAERLKLDETREKSVKALLDSLPEGYSSAAASFGVSVPSLSDGGSVSPRSSISVAEVNKMEKLIAQLTARVAELIGEQGKKESEVKVEKPVPVPFTVEERQNMWFEN